MKITRLLITLVISGIYLINTSVSFCQTTAPSKPATNIADALKHPLTEFSMPGKFPGKVIKVNDSQCIADNKISADHAYKMVLKGMLELTGEKNINDAWLKFVTPKDRIGLKVNPIGGPTLTTSVEVTQAIIKQLIAAGVPKENILIWDRRSADLNGAGFTKENFPGIKIVATEYADEKGSMYDSNGKLYGEQMIDKNWYYWADCEEKYDAETIPYMINEGKYSYFSKIVTQMVDKIINVPVLKNAGASITLCLKNLAYGSITNSSRLHKQLWAETCAEVCAFPPLRDKVVLNIVDAIKGCYNGGPAANPQFFAEYKTLLFGSDAVAVDRIGYEIILKKRIEEKIQKEESPRGRTFINFAQDLKLGIGDLDKIQLKQFEMN